MEFFLKANVSKSEALRQRIQIWLRENKSFENVYQSMSHDCELSEKLFYEEILIAYGFTTGPCEGYFNRHCFFVEDAEVIDITFNSIHQLELREYTVVELYTLSEYLDLVEYEYDKSLSDMNIDLVCSS